MNRRVVVTGLGAVSPLGIGFAPYWQGLRTGRSGIRSVTRFEVGDLPIWAAGEVPDFKARDFIPKDHRKALKVMALDVQMGVAAAMSAIEHAGIITETRRVDPTRLGVSFGAGFITSDIDEMGPSFIQSFQDGPDRFGLAQGRPEPSRTGDIDLKRFGVEAMKGFFPLWLLKYLPNMPACHISIFVDAEAPSNSITSGDAASAQALGEACRVIERGAADVMICGGTDGKVNPISINRYILLGWANTRRRKPEEMSRPFEKGRAGFVTGEGAAAMILEGLEHAKARGAKIYAEVRGYGAGCDAYRVAEIHPEGRGLGTAMKGALRDAKLGPSDIGAVFAAAKGSIEGDRAEARALNTVLGARNRTPVTSTKSMIGFISAASGIFDAVAAVGAVGEDVIPPTLNYDAPDPECAVNVVGKTAREAKLDHVLVNSGGFGGQFASLVISKFRD